MARAPLSGLRAFEAAARHMSFAKAADELAVTPSALSHQIKQLEAHFGVALFERVHRAVRLTAAGRALAPDVARGFDAFARAEETVARLGAPERFTVTAGPAFTAKWLAPRFFDFARRAPEVELRFVASLRLMDLELEDVDAAIRFGSIPSDRATLLIEDWLVPACAPQLAERLGGAPDPASLIHDDSAIFLDPRPDWPAWARAAGRSGDWSAGPRFSQADHAIDAAIAGAGIVLGRAALIEGELASGRLVAIDRRALRAGGAFRYCLPSHMRSQKIAADFRDWLASELTPLDRLAEEFELMEPHHDRRRPGGA